MKRGDEPQACLSSSNTHQTNIYVDSLTSFPSALKMSGGLETKLPKEYSAFSSSITSAINYFQTKRSISRHRKVPQDCESEQRETLLEEMNGLKSEVQFLRARSSQLHSQNVVLGRDNTFFSDKLAQQQIALLQLEQQNRQLRESLHLAQAHSERCHQLYLEEKREKEENYQTLTNFVNQYIRERGFTRTIDQQDYHNLLGAAPTQHSPHPLGTYFFPSVDLKASKFGADQVSPDSQRQRSPGQFIQMPRATPREQFDLNLLQNLKGQLAEKNNIIKSLRHHQKTSYPQSPMHELNLSEMSHYEKPPFPKSGGQEKTPKRKDTKGKASLFNKTATRPDRLKY